MHYSKIATPPWWGWKNFTKTEVSCKHCGEIWQGKDEHMPQWFITSMDCLQALRNEWGKPLIINSGHRCLYHNAAVGGVRNSKHLTHIAFDVRCSKAEQPRFCKLAEKHGFKFVLPYPDRGFVHIDIFERG